MVLVEKKRLFRVVWVEEDHDRSHDFLNGWTLKMGPFDAEPTHSQHVFL